jgi:hypothetical protein
MNSTHWIYSNGMDFTVQAARCVFYLLEARCPSDNDDSPRDGRCSESVYTNYGPEVAGYIQKAHDKCCQTSNLIVVSLSMDLEIFNETIFGYILNKSEIN